MDFQRQTYLRSSTETRSQYPAAAAPYSITVFRLGGPAWRLGGLADWRLGGLAGSRSGWMLVLVALRWRSWSSTEDLTLVTE